jgi:hypothetical protein
MYPIEKYISSNTAGINVAILRAVSIVLATSTP